MAKTPQTAPTPAKPILILPCDGTQELSVPAGPLHAGITAAAPTSRIEHVALELIRSGQFRHAWLGSCSTGELVMLCLMVGTPAALKRLPRSYATLPDAWNRLSPSDRAAVQRVWAAARYR